MCIGGGGGGSAGVISQGQAASPGGASGAVTRALFNASQLPDALYVQVGLGGLGATANGVTGGTGNRSFVSLQPVNNIAQNLVIASGNAAAAGGNRSSTALGETAMTTATATFGILANFTSTVGVSSPIVGVPIPTSITPLTSQVTSPGALGAGIVFGTPTASNGGSILSSSISPLIPGGVLASASGSNGGRGADGITSWKPFYSLGGAGGGSAISGSGGNGGDGGIGSGGGGGGHCSLGYLNGSGGKGGDGLVVIVAF